jgi:dipeptidyl-peptidase-4
MTGYKYIFIALLFIILPGTLSAQFDFVTAAERTDFKQTSSYDDVMTFLFEAQKKSDKIQVLALTTSTEGRMIPLAVISREGVKSPGELRLTGKPAVLINANIHAGEVEGKEAVQMLIRDIITGKEESLLDNQVILIIPIFNADGNDKFGHNRRDNGPEFAGVRFNGQGFDLNRDSIKLQSPEMKALVRLLAQWDPVLFIDMHTTNGSYHREPVTYNTLLDPNADTHLSAYMWQTFFPAVSATLKDKYGYDSLPYGNFVDRTHPEKGWISDAVGARYVTNYVGLRNRFTVLNENYSYADFKTRVLASFGFIKSILRYSSQHLREMQEIVINTDKKTMDNYHAGDFTLEYKNEKLMELTILSYEFELEKIKPEDRDKYPPWVRDYIVKKTDVFKNYKVDYIANPVPLRTVSLPEAYIILPYQTTVIETLKNHGIIVERIRKPLHADVENFVVKKVELDKQLYQGNVFVKVEGEYVEKPKEAIPEGAYYVSMRQPLARLLPVMLEPGSEDSLLTWGFFNRVLVSQWGNQPQLYPVYRLHKRGIPIERYRE